MTNLWKLAHFLDDSGFKTLRAFLDRDKPYEPRYSMKTVFKPVVNWDGEPATDRDAVKHEIKSHLVELEVQKDCLETAIESIKNEMQVLNNYHAEIIEQEQAEAKAKADGEFRAEMEKKEAERREKIDKTHLNRWREARIERDYSGGQLLKVVEEVPEYRRKYIANGEIYETLDWVAFLDILPLEHSYNEARTNRFEVNYGLIPSPENFLNHERDAHHSKPSYNKTSRRFKTEPEAKDFYTKTKERLEKELKRKIATGKSKGI